jgi:hypothetical protein
MTWCRLLVFGLLSAGVLAFGQSVVSTHSGVLYFFEGSVFIGDQKAEQKFGKFPDVGEGQELRTEKGRAEVLLTPGVFLRLGDNSAIRMLSNQLADTKVELLRGSAILEANTEAPGTKVTLAFKNWTMRVPEKGVYRIDSEPARVESYKGEVEVSADGKTDAVTLKEGDSLPLAEVLVADKAAETDSDDFKNWAMMRSQAVSADNAIAAQIVDDPNKMDATGLGLGMGPAIGGVTYFPVGGIPSLGLISPYGLSFWSPYQSTLSSLYFPPYLYGVLFTRWPSPTRFSPIYGRPIIFPTGIGTRPRPVGVIMPGGTYANSSHTTYHASPPPPVVVRPMRHR